MRDLMIQFLAQSEPWFSSQNQAIIGGALGGAVGLLGAIYGTALGLLLPRGKGKRFIFGLHWISLAFGVSLLAAGITALLTGQPYGVWYALLLPGLIATLLLSLFTPLLTRLWYRQVEHRRLEAEEFRRG